MSTKVTTFWGVGEIPQLISRFLWKICSTFLWDFFDIDQNLRKKKCSVGAWQSISNDFHLSNGSEQKWDVAWEFLKIMERNNQRMDQFQWILMVIWKRWNWIGPNIWW